MNAIWTELTGNREEPVTVHHHFLLQCKTSFILHLRSWRTKFVYDAGERKPGRYDVLYSGHVCGPDDHGRGGHAEQISSAFFAIIPSKDSFQQYEVK